MGFINIKYPIEDDLYTNSLFKMNSTTKEGLGSDLLLLLLTQKGERFYDPNYGTNLIKFIFEPNDNITEDDISKDIKKTISEYMPALTITKIQFINSTKDSTIAEDQVNVLVDFVYSEGFFNETGQLQIKF